MKLTDQEKFEIMCGEFVAGELDRIRVDEHGRRTLAAVADLLENGKDAEATELTRRGLVWLAEQRRNRIARYAAVRRAIGAP